MATRNDLYRLSSPQIFLIRMVVFIILARDHPLDRVFDHAPAGDRPVSLGGRAAYRPIGGTLALTLTDLILDLAAIGDSLAQRPPDAGDDDTQVAGRLGITLGGFLQCEPPESTGQIHGDLTQFAQHGDIARIAVGLGQAFAWRC